MKKSVHVAAALVALILPLVTGSLAFAQSGPSVQEQMACRSDAGKFCAEHVGKPPQMNACLKANKANLSTPAARWWNRAADKAAGIIKEDRSIQIEQPDPGRFDPHRLAGEGLSRLGYFPDSLLDRLQLLFARLSEAALLFPALAAFGAPLFNGRPLDVGVARPGENLLGRGGLFAGLLGRLRG
ncbi:cysteine rich repeat-containing protein [Bradyrhizobium sp. TZ2]